MTSSNEEKEKNSLPKMTKSAQIWEEIKVKNIDLFAIQQKVEDVCEYVAIDDEKCFLTARSGAVLPMLEEAIKEKYSCEMSHKYIIVEPKKASL